MFRFNISAHGPKTRSNLVEKKRESLVNYLLDSDRYTIEEEVVQHKSHTDVDPISRISSVLSQ